MEEIAERLRAAGPAITASTLPLTAGFREKFQCNNWNYTLAALVSEPLAGVSLGHYLTGDNISEDYVALAKSTPLRTERPSVGDEGIMFGAMGVNSRVNDLLVY
ncbi:hypothetical protein B0H63DRAFT_528770 [Podospora didyma]|uniref:Uncharacterized protein n=1 Tax=Podospora didyma TaxID=330526 RepID=A0AAE0K2Y5_9PEZI|nr:hypothetical protein B0H63DRAFT_528770 [Podospora didyma]